MSAELHYKNDDFEVELDGNIYSWLYDNPDVFPPPEPDWY